jgi:hypothetical protein
MTKEQIALSRRAVASGRWQWAPGALDQFGRRVINVWPDDLGIKWSHLLDNRVVRDADALPDLSDPATLGCLLALVRKAWRCPTVYVRQSSTVGYGILAWEVCDLYLDAEACRALGVPREGSVGSWGHGSEAEALVAALEGAP